VFSAVPTAPPPPLSAWQAQVRPRSMLGRDGEPASLAYHTERT